MLRQSARACIALACVVAMTTGASISPNTHPVYPEDVTDYDYTVDMTGASNPCALIQSALYGYLSGAEPNATIRITGTGVADLSDYHRAQYWNGSAATNGPFDYCFMEAGSAHWQGYYPVSDDMSLTTVHGGRIFFDSASLTLGCTGQTRPIVGWAAGSAYMSGYDSSAATMQYGGAVSFGKTVIGDLSIQYDTSCDTPATDGEIQSFSATTLFTSATTRVGVMYDGMKRRNASRFALTINGVNTDGDDYGQVIVSSGSNKFGPTLITNTGVGLLLVGPIISDFTGWTITSNDYGVMFGTPLHGGDIIPFGSCAGGTTWCTTQAYNTNSAKFQGGTIEGNEFGEVVMFEGGSVNVFANTYIEGVSAMKGHAVLIGAGYCNGGTRDQMAGGTAGDCPGGGTLTCPAGDANFTLTRFVGGTVAGDKGCVSSSCGGAAALSDWQGTMIGGCADSNGGKVQIQGDLLSSTLDSTDVVAFDWADTELTGYINMPSVDVTGLLRYGNFYWPNYPQLQHAGSISIPFGISDATWTAGEYIPLVPSSTNGVAATALDAFITIPWVKAIRYQLHRLDLGTTTVMAGTDSCDFIPVIGNYPQTTATDATITGNVTRLSGTTIAAGTKVTAAFTPHASLLLNPGDSPDDTQVGLRVTTSSTCNELYVKGTMTLLPLE